MEMTNFLQDVRYGIRMLAKSPGFTAVAVITLALGIGANTAIFSVVRAVLLKSLPYPEPDRLMSIREFQTHKGDMSVSWMNFLDWRAQNQSFERMAVTRADHAVMTGAGEPTLLRAGRVSAAFFPLLGAKPILGRSFSEEEDTAAAIPMTVLSYSLWRTRFGGDAAIVGKNVMLDDEAYNVIGVMPPEFNFFEQKIDLYTPIGLRAKIRQYLNRGNHQGLTALARLRPGVSLSAARAELEGIAKRLELQYPETNSGDSAVITPLYESRVSEIRPALLVLLGAVACVLLIACVNVANLLLARAAARSREFAIRASIGAGRGRIVQQLLTESVLLSLIGGFLGLLVATWAIGPLLRIAPPDIPRLGETEIDRGVFVFTLLVTFFSGILFGLAPAFQASRSDVNTSLRESGRSSTPGRPHQRLRAALLISEVSLAVVLVIGSGLLIRSLLKALDVNPGFRADHVLALDVNLPLPKYKEKPSWVSFMNQAVERIHNLPGVESASAVMCPPLVGDCWDSVFSMDDRPVPPQAELPSAVFNNIEPGYFRTLQTPLLAGRTFTQADTQSSAPVVLINETMARRWWPGGNPIGKRIKQGWPKDDVPFREIIGIVGDLHQDGPDQPLLPEVFLPAGQYPFSSMTILVRTKPEPSSLATAAVDAIHGIDADQPVSNIKPMTAYLSESLGSRKFLTLLLGLFGGLALLLATVGIYGVMAYTVSLRTHELGIRVALGAQRGDVFGLIVGFGARLALAGIAIGLAGSLALARLMQSQLFGVSSLDPATFVAVAVLLCCVAVAACYIPARRAMRVDPIVALRYE
jgi:putative ABC transport system permease protein